MPVSAHVFLDAKGLSAFNHFQRSHFFVLARVLKFCSSVMVEVKSIEGTSFDVYGLQSATHRCQSALQLLSLFARRVRDRRPAGRPVGQRDHRVIRARISVHLHNATEKMVKACGGS